MKRLPNSTLAAKANWQLVAEVLVAAVGLPLVILIWGNESIANFIQRSAKDWAQLEGVLLAASLVVWGMYVNFTTSGFGDYLRWSHREKSYRRAFSISIFAPLAACILLVIAGSTPAGWIHYLAIPALNYSLLNVYTMYRNIVGLSDRKREFDDLISKTDE